VTKQRAGYALLILCMMAPLFGPFSEIFSAIIITLLVAFGVKAGHHLRPWDPLKMLGAVFTGYFGLLFAAGLISDASLWQTLDGLSPTSPVLILGLAAIFSDPKWLKVDNQTVGNIATFSIYTIYLGALFLWQFQIDIQLDKSLLHYTQVNGRLTLFAVNALLFGAIMVTLCGLSFLGWGQKTALGKMFSLGAFCIGVIIVGLWTEARGPFLTLGLLLIPISMGAWFYLSSEKIVRPVALAVAAVLAGAGFLFWPMAASAFERLINGLTTLQDGQNYDYSTYLRLVMYSAAWDAFSDNWLFGYGPHARFSAIAAHFPSGTDIAYSHAHNVFLNHAVAAGIFGLCAVFSVLLAPVVLAWKYAKVRFGSELYLASILSLSMIGCGLSNVLLFHDLTAYFFATLSVIAAAALSQDSHISSRQ
jgi:O-antigen ligase